MRDERLLLYLKNYLGDAVMTEPLAQVLGTSYRHVSVVTSKFVEPVLWSPEYSFEFQAPEKTKDPWSVVRAALRLRGGRYSVAVLVNRSFRAALVARLAGIRRRVGHQSEGRDFLLTDRIPYPHDRFEAYCTLDLAKPLGLPITERNPRLAITGAEREGGKGLLGSAVVGLQPGARFPAKQMPLETTIHVAQQLQDRGYAIAFFGGNEEAEDAERVKKHLKQPVIDLVGKTSIRTLVGTLANLKVMLGNDTGVLHLAAGAGCPVVQVFGPTPAAKWGHDYGRNRVLLAPEGDMTRVDPDAVLQATLEVLEGA